MKTEIHIDPEPFAETRYYSGTYLMSDPNNQESELVEYSFTISSQLDENCNIILILDITWIDDEPPQREAAEEQIKKVWHST